MKQQDLLEYRKVSAKELFHHEQIRHSIELCEVRYRNEWREWQPDTDANQMLIVWKKLPSKIIEEIIDDYLSGHPVLTATMRAFMEYIKIK